MPVQDLSAKVFDEGTDTKLDIFEKYMEAWLPVFFDKDSVNIIDFFAGTGTDLDGNPGSPLRILKVLKDYDLHILNNKMRINLLFNEYDQTKYESLKNNLEKGMEELSLIDNLINLEIYNVDFQKLFLEKLPSIRNAINLIFFDQNGVRHVTKDIIFHLESFSTTDFMFFISSSYFSRFEFTNYFPDINYEKIRNSEFSDIHRIILEHYRSFLPSDSRTKLYPFSIKKEKGIYGLVFGTKHPLGVEKFLDIAWNKNKLNGEANFDIDNDEGKGQLDLFCDKKLTKVEYFENELEEYVASQEEVSNFDVYDFTLSRGFTPRHAIKVLVKMKKEGRVNFYLSPKIGYDYCYGKKTEFVIF